ncbi:MAG TPA: DHA2 family efflux MFS transporter permease subunit [Polyangia bacterium]|nr:DHA2 family efflux MFS transporter permease subunit [Polyangia bacterium]
MVAASLPNVATRAPTNKWLVTVSITFGTLMGTIDASIVNVAVPHLSGSLGATVEQITWVTTGFVMANVIVMPLTAFLGRLFGQKRVYMFCLGLFLVGSMLCGMARSLEMLVVCRVLQGLGAGALQPTEQAILRQTFPPEEQGMAMALFGLAVMIGPAFGPTLGGYIVDNWSWPWIFYINLPVGLLGLFMVSTFVHEPEDVRQANLAAAAKQRKHMDWAGIALLSIGLASLQYVLEEGIRKDWFESSLITVLAIVAVIALLLFVARELTAEMPAVNLSLFKDTVFTSGTLVGGVMFAMLMSVTFILPVFMQELLGYDAMKSGIALMPRSLIMFLVVPIVGRIYNKVQPRIVVGFGVICFTISAYQMSHYTLETSEAQLLWPLLIQGVGFACLFVPLTTVALSSIDRKKLADATGLNSLVRQIGGSLGLAVFATLMTRYPVQIKAAIGAHLTAGRPEVTQRLAAMTQLLVSKGYDAASARMAAERALGGIVARQAMMMTFEKMFLMAGIAFLFVMPLLYFLKSPNHGGGGPKPEVHVEM